MSAHSIFVLFLVAPFSSVLFVQGDQFLAGQGAQTVAIRDEDFFAAMGSIMGCSGTSSGNHDDLEAIEHALMPMWRVLPKNGHGLVEWRMLRYVMHRYFMQRYSLLIRGFEPTFLANSSDVSSTGILGQQAPSFIESALLGKQNTKGFALSDAAIMVATLERLIFDSETKLLKSVYRKMRQPSSGTLRHADLSKVIQVYLLHWLIADDEEGVELLMTNASLREEVIPQWQDIRDFVNGVVKSLEFKRQRAPVPGHGMVAMTQRYSFDDAHEVVGTLTKTFASYWVNECRQVKGALVKLDKASTGRVRLADFYGANLDGQWHFGESEAYLRELGALDESSTTLGAQVIIPNYIQGASNCVVGTAHYLVCCVNECEEHLNYIEDAVGASVAEPAQILDLVSNITTEDDELVSVAPALRDQLLRIAEIHGGQVPLHGRLFSQWLHYALPRECPFPHKSGSVNSTVHVNDYGESSIASPEEVRNHASSRGKSNVNMDNVEEAQWMTQWSEEEELHADYITQLHAPWEVQIRRGWLHYIIVLIGVALVWSGVVGARGKAADVPVYDFQQRTHVV